MRQSGSFNIEVQAELKTEQTHFYDWSNSTLLKEEDTWKFVLKIVFIETCTEWKSALKIL